MNTSISIIVPTINGVDTIDKLIESIPIDDHNNHEIIIIDQNENSILPSKLSKYNSYDIRYIRSDRKGLSINRNIGIKNSKHDWIHISDDDAVFDDNFFNEITKKIKEEPLVEVWFSKVLNLENREYYTHKLRFNKFQLSNLKEICSIGLTIRKQLILNLGGFNENFGIGAQYGACEESDFILRAYKNKSLIKSSMHTAVLHRKRIKNYKNFERIKNYSLGFGALHRKHISWENIKVSIHMIWSILVLLFRSTAGFLINLFNNKRKFYYYSVYYKIYGFLKYQDA